MKKEDFSQFDYVFICSYCGLKFGIYKYDDPTSSSGCCKCCGSKNWKLVDSVSGFFIC